MLNGEKANEIKINIDEIPDSVFDIGCFVLNSSIRRMFQNPEISAEYKEWLKSDEAKKFN